MTIAEYSILFFTVFLGGMTHFYFRKLSPMYLKLLLSFSGAYLFALSVVHLIPEVYSGRDYKIGYFVLLGFFIQLFLETFTQGIEHGHVHFHHKHPNDHFPLAMIIGLCFHSFIEGMPLVQQKVDDSVHHSLLTGIILHHIPVAIALMSMLSGSGIKNSSTVIYLLLFSSMAPLGAFASETIGAHTIADMQDLFSNLMAVVIGIFLHISTTILFESHENHRFNYLKLLVILLGAGLALL